MNDKGAWNVAWKRRARNTESERKGKRLFQGRKCARRGVVAGRRADCKLRFMGIIRPERGDEEEMAEEKERNATRERGAIMKKKSPVATTRVIKTPYSSLWMPSFSFL